MRRDVVTIGSSGGGIEALTTLLGALPADLPAAVFVVLHRYAGGGDGLPRIIGRASPLTVRTAVDGDPITPGVVLLAPSDHHLFLERDHVVLDRGPRENNCRPAVDPLFRSAARAFGARVIGVVLTGALDDGTAGLYAIKRHGGLAVVQDPRDAAVPGMPTSARDNVPVDHVVPLVELGPLLARLTREEVASAAAPDHDEAALDAETHEGVPDASETALDELGEPSTFTCPECHGTLWELESEQPLRFRCRVGHAFSAAVLDEKLGAETEAALWAAVRTLHENARLARSLSERFEARRNARLAAHFAEKAQLASRQAVVLRALIPSIGGDPGLPHRP
jgi:two-component system chemotaxis response regulator CheB